MRITTSTNETGSVTAKGGGKQRTVKGTDHAAHGAAAGSLMLALGLPFTGASIAVDASTGKGTFEV